MALTLDENGNAWLTIDSQEGAADVPVVDSGERVEVRHGDAIVLTGTYYKD